MRVSWKGKWRSGEIVIEAETLEELNNILDKLFYLSEAQAASQVSGEEFPQLPSGLGCSDAIRALLQTEWGRESRSMAEIKEALEANALYFSNGTLSGTLTLMTKGGYLRRVKKADKWAYAVKSS
jgi:hypothetical protein